MHEINATMTLEVELELTGTYVRPEPDRGPEYGSIAGPGHEPYAEDAEVTGLFVEVVKRNRWGWIVYDNPDEPLRCRRAYERVDVLAKVSPEARREVLDALSSIIAHEAAETLIEAEAA
jgi:hypothetical protein